MRTASCPTAADLEQLFQGGLTEAEAQAREEHVLTCDGCLQQLKSLVRTRDTLADQLREQETDHEDASSGPEVASLMKQLKSLRSASAPAGAATKSLACPACRKKLTVKESQAGKKVKCPGCGQVFPVPAPAPASAGKRPTHSGANLLEATLDSQASDAVPDASLTDFLSPPRSADELGRLGKYRILKVLGHGGMGVVFKAEDPLLKRHVALKAMLPTLAASASAGKRFLREAQAMAAVEHDHIVRVHEVGEERGVPFLAMEFLKGEPLDERLKQKKLLPVLDVVRIGREIAEGLAAAHEHGLIHRDIKPGNIWLEAPKGRVKILDFGLARSAAQEAGLTQQGAIIGTPSYMAPEQGRGDAVDARCDLFSLGVILYRLSSGQPAFRGKDTISTLMAVANEQPPPPRVASPAMPPELSDLVMHLLEKDAARRPSSAAAVVETLRTLEKKLTRQREATEATEALPAAPAMPARPAARKPAVRPAARRHRRWPLVVGAAALLLLAGLAGAWATGLIRFQSDKGDYVIECDDPDFAFSPVKGGGLTLEDRKTKKTYQVKVAPQGKDEFELEVTDAGGDLTFKSKTFTVKRGDKVVLKAWFERKDAAAVKPPADKDSDRRAAEYVLSVGGTVKVNEQDQEIKAAADLPREAFRLAQVILWQKQATDAGLAAFKGCKDLKELDLSHTPVTDAGLANFKDCKGLTDLDLSATQVSDAGLAHFKDCKGLKKLWLYGTSVKGAGLAAFKDCKGLTDLNLGSSEISETGLAHFKDCKNLTRILVKQTNVTAAGIDELKKTLPKCKIEWDGGTIEPMASLDPDRRAAEYVLSIGGTVKVNGQDQEIRAAADLPRESFRLCFVKVQGSQRVTDADLAVFKGCKNLTQLMLQGLRVTDMGLAHFQDCPNLTEVWLDQTRVTDAGLALFKDNSHLIGLSVCSTLITDAGLAHLKGCKNLTGLSIQGTLLTDDGLADLAGLDKLTIVSLQKTKVTAKGVEGLAKARPKCKIFWDGGVIPPK